MLQRVQALSRCGALGVLAIFGLGAATHAAEANFKGGAMLDCSGLPCVEVVVDSGTTLKLLVDTGNFRSVLDKGAAQRLRLELKPFVGPDGKVHPEYSSATLKSVKIGAAEVGDVSVMVTDVMSDVAKVKGSARRPSRAIARSTS